MSKNIVFCADGTWNTDQKQTNVSKIWAGSFDDPTQVVFYDDGVGADGNIIVKLLGGAAGIGLWKKIKIGYQTIAAVYAPEDPLYIFGFSRGAYTARCLAGMIARCGLPTKGDPNAIVDVAFDVYRRFKDPSALAPYAMFDAKITMVGVWDTVGALGIPALFGGADPIVYGFLDTGLHPDVLNAYHAVAIDEHRTEFLPTLWTSKPQPGQVLEQVWFCGAHCDVGGGDAPRLAGQPSLADITLAWMASKARPLGLRFRPEFDAQYPYPMDPSFASVMIDNSWKPLWGVPVLRPVPDTAVLGNSVAIRCQVDPRYRPDNLDFDDAGVLAPHYQLRAVVGPLAAAAAAQAGG